MAHLLRVARWLLLSALFVGGGAYAAVTYTNPSSTVFSPVGGTFTTASDACTAWQNAAQAAIVNTDGCTGADQVQVDTCPTPAPGQSATGNVEFWWRGNPQRQGCTSLHGSGTLTIQASSCTGGQSADSSGTCVCPSGQTLVNGVCVTQQQVLCQDAAGKSGGRWAMDTGVLQSANNPPVLHEWFICPEVALASPPGCEVKMTAEMGYVDGTPPAWWQVGNSVFTGSPCNPDAPGGDGIAPGSDVGTGTGTSVVGTPTAAVSSCPPGQLPGQVNGVTICAPAGSSTPAVSSGSSGSSGSTTGTTTTTGPDGQPITTTTTKSTDASCSNGQCVSTTTVTVTSSGAGGTPTSTTTQSVSSGSLGDFCKSNPTNALCGGGGGGGNSDTWGGSCMSGFQCTGDAPLCAAAQGVWQQKCALIDGPTSPTTEQQLFAAAKAGNAASSTLGTDNVEVGPSNFDSSNALGVAAQCLTDVVIVVWGKSVTLPFSTVCPYLAIMGSILLAVAWLMAAVIVGKGIQGGSF